MKGGKMYLDIGTILDDIFEHAKDFGEGFKKMGPDFANIRGFERGEDDKECIRPSWFGQSQDESADYYPGYLYPPMNIYLTSDRGMVFEFALAGFEEKDISLSFQGDHMVFSATIDVKEVPEQDVRYFKRRLKLKDIEKQKYYVPADKFNQEGVKAVFKNGILRISIPPKEETVEQGGIKIEIVSEDSKA